jgi:hypothetical protein
MQTSALSLTLAAFALPVAAGAGCLALLWFVRRRLAGTERALAHLTEDLSQMAELQLALLRKVTGELRHMEEKLLDLTLPAPEAPLPLERRHRVLALARKGMAAAEIADRLGMPGGEVELILGMKGLAEARAASPAVRPQAPEQPKEASRAMLA